MSNKKTKLARDYKSAARADLKLFKARAEEARTKVNAIAEGSLQLQAATDALTAAIAVQYGTEVKDDSGAVIGYRLELPRFNIAELLAKYNIKASQDPVTGDYTIGVILK